MASESLRAPGVPPAPGLGVLAAVLAEALADPGGGEVLVRSPRAAGRIFVARGRIAWATASTLSLTFGVQLVRSGLVQRDSLSALFEECRKTGKNFAEEMVEWKLLDEPTLRRELLAHIASAMREILSWPGLTALFVPTTRGYKGSLTFALDEFLAAAGAAPEFAALVRELQAATEDRPPEPVALTPAPVAAIVPAPAAPAEAAALAERRRARLDAILVELREALPYQAAGFLGPGGALLAQAAPVAGLDVAALGEAIAQLGRTVRGRLGQPGPATALGLPGEWVLRGAEAILAVRQLQVAGVGHVSVFVRLPPTANVALARMQLDRTVPNLVAALVDLVEERHEDPR